MGLISGILGFQFGNERNIIRETVEVFRENAESGAERGLQVRQQAVSQFGAEFHGAGKAPFDRVIDGLNRLPRPAMALGTLGLFVAAMVDPIWFSARKQGSALVPEPLWWLLGVIVSIYFGARHQAKVQELQCEISATMMRTPQVLGNIKALASMRSDSVGVANADPDAALTADTIKSDENPALETWRRKRTG